LVVAGGPHPRLAAAGDPYAASLQQRWGATADFTGYVPGTAVADWFAAADVALIPYPRPFATSGPLALALGAGTPALLSVPLAAFVDALSDWQLVATTSDPVLTEAEHGIATVSALDPRAVARAVGRAEGVVFAGGTVFKTLHPRSGRRPLELLRNGLGVATAT